MRTTHTAATAAPPWGRGHYDAAGARWWDDEQERWLDLADEEDELEIDVEDVGGRSVWSRIATTMTSQYGTLMYRFVARARSQDPRWPVYTVASGTFPVQPLQLPLESMAPGDGWGAEVTDRFRELEDDLVAHGWRPAGRGRAWWAKRCTRPTLAEPTP